MVDLEQPLFAREIEHLLADTTKQVYNSESDFFTSASLLPVSQNEKHVSLGSAIIATGNSGLAIAADLQDSNSGTTFAIDNAIGVAQVVVRATVYEAAEGVKAALLEELEKYEAPPPPPPPPPQEHEDLQQHLYYQHDEPDAKFFLETNLTRNLSILPSDVADAATAAIQAEATELLNTNEKVEDHERCSSSPSYGIANGEEIENQPEISKTPPSRTIPWFAYMLLVLSVVSLSAIGPLFTVQEGASASAKLIWRMLSTALFLSPKAALDIWREGFPILTAAEWLMFLGAVVAYDASCLGFVLALDYTAVSNVLILSNSQSILLLVGRVCLGSSIRRGEAIGAAVAFCGVILCSKDSSDSATTRGLATLLGDLLGLVSGIGTTLYLVLCKNIRAKMTLFVFMFLIMLVGCLLIILFQTTVSGETITADMDIKNGVWGWLQPAWDRLPLEITIVVVCNVFGTMGYVRSMQYFDNIVIAVAALMEPVVAEFMETLMGVGVLPGWKSWLGNTLVAAGTFAVVYPFSVGTSARDKPFQVEDEDVRFNGTQSKTSE